MKNHQFEIWKDALITLCLRRSTSESIELGATFQIQYKLDQIEKFLSYTGKWI
jgi:hypothetical protein